MKIKFNRSILIAGQHHEAGTAADIELPLAAELIQSLDASPFSENIETATLTPTAEKAQLPAPAPKKNARKK